MPNLSKILDVALGRGELSRGARAASFALWGLPFVVLAFFLSLSLNSVLDDEPNGADARQNLTSAYNVVYKGVYSHADRENPDPSNYREPLPVYFMALHIAMTPELASGLTFDEMNLTETVVLVKRHNLYWAFLCLAGLAAACFTVIRQRWIAAGAALFAIYFTYHNFLQDTAIINRMMTEIQAATLLVWLAVALTMALRTRRAGWFLAAGVLLGGLALTKAIFLYVGIGLVLSLALFYIPWPGAISRVRMAVLLAALGFGMAATIAPWIARNYVVLADTKITDRGPRILHARMYRSAEMTDVEYAGAWYYYAPHSVRGQMGRWLGFSGADFEAGGRLERIYRGQNANNVPDREAERSGRPQDAVAFNRVVRAERRRLRNEFRRQGGEESSTAEEEAVNDVLKAQTAQMFADHPWGYFRSIPLFLWRGMGFVGPPLLILAAVGLAWRRPALIGLTLAPAGGVAILALASHFLSRYGDPFEPSVYLTEAAIAGWGVSWLTTRVQDWSRSRLSERTAVPDAGYAEQT